MEKSELTRGDRTQLKRYTGVYPVAGRRITAVDVDRENDVVTIQTDQGGIKLYHERDCCESVTIEDVTGDVDGLIGATIREFRETFGDGKPDDDYNTWTLYDLVTDRADVQLRWIGESNGYYSEAVTVEIDGVEVEVTCNL